MLKWVSKSKSTLRNLHGAAQPCLKATILPEKTKDDQARRTTEKLKKEAQRNPQIAYGPPPRHAVTAPRKKIHTMLASQEKCRHRKSPQSKIQTYSGGKPCRAKRKQITLCRNSKPTRELSTVLAAPQGPPSLPSPRLQRPSLRLLVPAPRKKIHFVSLRNPSAPARTGPLTEQYEPGTLLLLRTTGRRNPPTTAGSSCRRRCAEWPAFTRAVASQLHTPAKLHRSEQLHPIRSPRYTGIKARVRCGYRGQLTRGVQRS